jgi:hypothetical protein
MCVCLGWKDVSRKKKRHTLRENEKTDALRSNNWKQEARGSGKREEKERGEKGERREVRGSLAYT